MRAYTYILVCACCLLFPAAVQSQEICNNGIDDDANGFADCSDPACAFGENIFPIIENFDSGTFDNPNWVRSGSAYINTGWLTLTDDIGGQAGSAFLDTQFVSTNHIIIEFDYATVNYNGDNCFYGIGDGLAFYLTDGNAGPSIGEPGAALGYSHGVSGDPSRGIDGGFIGIGLDEFGSFYGTNAGPSSCPPAGDDAVTIRGEETADNFTAYRCLATTLLPWNMDIDVASRAEARRVRVLLSPGGVLDLYINFNDGAGFIPVFFGLSTGQVVPPTFKLGFSASTGGACIAHEIDNVIVAKPADIDVNIEAPSAFNICDGQIEYVITAVNHGPNDVSQVYLQAALPAGLTAVSWNCADCLPVSGGAAPVNAAVSLEVGDTVVMTVTASVDASVAGSAIMALAGIDFACTDFITSDIDNSMAEASTDIIETALDLSLGPDTGLCAFPFILDATLQGATYVWQDGSVSPSFSVTGGGIYWVEATSGSCTSRDSIAIEDISFDVDLGPNRNLCAGPVILDATTAGATYIWQDGFSGPVYTVGTSGVYWVDVSKDGCTVRDSAVVEDGSFEVNLGPDTVLCNNSILLNAAEPGAAYLWSDGSTGSTLAASTGGTYWVEVTIGNCRNGDTVLVTDNSFSVDLGEDRAVCETVVELDATTPGATYLWQENSTGPVFIADSSGIYSVVVTSENCTAPSSITLEFLDCSQCHYHAPTAFSPNRDGFNDFFQLIFDCETGVFNMEIFNRWGERVFATDDPLDGWDGTYKGVNCLGDVFVWKARYSDDSVTDNFATGVVLILR